MRFREGRLINELASAGHGQSLWPVVSLVLVLLLLLLLLHNT